MDLTPKPLWFTAIALYGIITIRYFIVSGFFYWFLWYRRKPYWEARKLQDTTPSRKKILSEIKWSVITSLFFAVPGAVMIEGWKRGHTQIYTDLSLYGGWVYVPISLAIYFLFHDTYFYWTHRWMHSSPRVFKTFHRVHHDFPNPTPWAAFSFHPYESIIEATIIPLLTFIIPIHIGALLFLLTAMTFFGVVNHVGYEIYPRKLCNGIIGQWMITPTHHNRHHREYTCNFGLYFRLWDRWMGTDKI